jgi:hypothetical protein
MSASLGEASWAVCTHAHRNATVEGQQWRWRQGLLRQRRSRRQSRRALATPCASSTRCVPAHASPRWGVGSATHNAFHEAAMNAILRNALALAGVAFATQAAAQLTFYEREGFEGRSFTTREPIRNFENRGFNDRASSVVVLRSPWEVCEDARFSGRCVVLRPGRYPSLAAMGLNDRVSSARVLGRNSRIDDSRYAPVPVVAEDYRWRGNERLYEASVTSVHAVLGPPERRCWIEHEQVLDDDRGGANVPGAIAGGPDWRHSRPSGRRWPRQGPGHRRWRRCRGRGGRQRRAQQWRTAGAHPGCGALLDGAQPGTARILGRHLRLPGRGAPRPVEVPSRSDRHRQPARRAPRVKALTPRQRDRKLTQAADRRHRAPEPGRFSGAAAVAFQLPGSSRQCQDVELNR